MTGPAKFQLGRVVATTGVHTAFAGAHNGFGWVTHCLHRHATGDWGQVDAHDAAANNRAATDDAIDTGARILSAYRVPDHLRTDDHPEDRIWIITSTEAWDADTTIRATTILWPSEY